MAIRRLTGICALAVFLGGTVWASDKPEDAAQAAADSWLKLVDERRYEASWDQAARIFKDAVTKDQWKQAAAAVRGPLGKLVSRTVKSREYTEIPVARTGSTSSSSTRLSSRTSHRRSRR